MKGSARARLTFKRVESTRRAASGSNTISSIIANIDLSTQIENYQRPIFNMDTVISSLESASISKSQKHDDLAQQVIAAPEPHTIEAHLVIVQSGLSSAPSPEDRKLCCECAKIDLEAIFQTDPGTIRVKRGIEVANFGRRLELAAATESSCYLCQFFWASRLPTTYSPYSYVLRAFSLFLSYPGLSGREIPTSVPAKNAIFLAVVPSNFRKVEIGSVEGDDSTVADNSVAEDEIVVELCWKYGYIFRTLPRQDMADADSTEEL
jgi:hypothetical protein